MLGLALLCGNFLLHDVTNVHWNFFNRLIKARIPVPELEIVEFRFGATAAEKFVHALGKILREKVVLLPARHEIEMNFVVALGDGNFVPHDFLPSINFPINFIHYIANLAACL